jgi:putative tryptophan/tyrosine transport system substrate-binding protein
LRRDRGYADIDRPPASIAFEAYDPKPSWDGLFCCDAHTVPSMLGYGARLEDCAVRRRKFIALFGGAAVSWPVGIRAQLRPMPVIGFLGPGPADVFVPYVTAFQKRVTEFGYVEGQTIAYVYRWAGERYDLFPRLAGELVQQGVAIIVTTGGPAPLAAKAASSTIPVLFVWGGDPVKMALVQSLNHPGGNVTGVNILVNALGAKRFGLLHELVPTTHSVGVLVNSTNPNSESELKEIREAASTIGQRIEVVQASSTSEIDAAFGLFLEQRVSALVVAADGFFLAQRDKLVALSARHALPTIYHQSEFAKGGGLMSYGTSLADAFRQVGTLAGRILKGEKPANLPVEQPTKFELVINLKTAKTLGLTIPPGVLAIADEVIE